MRENILTAIVVLAWVFFCYLLSSFVVWDLSPQDWGNGYRFVVALVTVYSPLS